ncbi:MAG: hypothetical protein JWN26_608 [Candidatus Saccharibacteria bacterium]|nr:hypothetical protein [Candidatus Saccharibacteria bacterium]
MSFRSWVTVITLILLALVVFLGHKEILRAFHLLGHVNIWILLLIIPVQLLSYYATGGMIFSYLRSKGNLKDTSHWAITRMALELNFVNHIIPSGGAAGFSYLGWVLSRFGVSAGRATMAQIVRFTIGFGSFIVLLLIAVGSLVYDNHISRAVIIITSSLTAAALLLFALSIYIIGNNKRLEKFSTWLTRTVNKFVSFVTRGRKKNTLKKSTIEPFFVQLHDDFNQIRADKRILIKPFVWGLVMNICDVALLSIAFMSLGFWVNPATLFVAFGVSGAASIFSVTPGGAGLYEAIMIAFLASAGVHPAEAIAGTLLARVCLLLGTIVFGYVFYQMTIVKYGKRPVNS